MKALQFMEGCIDPKEGAILNKLFPSCHVITYSNAILLSIKPSETDFNEICINILVREYAFKCRMHNSGSFIPG